MTTVNLTIKGAKALQKKINFMSSNVQNDVTGKAIVAGTFLVEDDAKRNVSGGPADEFSQQAWGMKGKKQLSDRKLNVREGFLRASITHKIFVDKTGDKVEGSVGTNKVYGRIHELGGMAGRGKKVLIPARPFLLPALLKNLETIKKMLAPSFWKMVFKTKGIK